MIVWLLRFIKRCLVLLIGLGVIYFAVWEIFPFFDHRIPLSLALLATYIFTAYFFVPFIIRVIRLFLEPDHIPLYCVTPDGFASDPVNIGIVGTKQQIVEAMQAAGWYMSDRRTPRNIIRLVYSTVFRRAYPTAPFSSLFLFGRKQDLGFQLPIKDRPTYRHHVRFWACHFETDEEFHHHVHFWNRFHKPKHGDDNERQLWVGAASKDMGIIPIRHNAQLTHMVDPDTDQERELIVDGLRKTHMVKKTKTVKVGSPYEVRNRTIGGLLRADGRMRICILKD
jgi:hypothetical protein